MSLPMTHALKCWPQYYGALLTNAKPFELRIADRPYAVGDLFVAQEWNPQSEQYTGRQCVRVIMYVGRDLPGLRKWHVALGLRDLTPFEDLLTEALNELFEVTRDPNRDRSDTEAVRKSIQDRANAIARGSMAI